MRPIDTQRLHLRPLEARDEALHRNIYTDPELMRFVAPALSAEGARHHFQHVHANIESGRWQFWVMQTHDQEAEIGLAGLIRRANDADDCAEIGTMILKDWHGKGYATEALKGVMNYAFSDMKLASLYGHHASENIRSIQLMSKLGFKRIRTTEPDHHWLAHAIP